jgi:2-aminoethylphosphonate-pyruvate transaminase
LSQAGGWSARHARYQKLAGAVARQLIGLGVVPLLAAADSSCVLRAYRVPDGRSYDAIHAGIKQRGFVIYSGQGRLASEIFRISTMGDISDYDMGRLGLALDCVFS